MKTMEQMMIKIDDEDDGIDDEDDGIDDGTDDDGIDDEDDGADDGADDEDGEKDISEWSDVILAVIRDEEEPWRPMTKTTRSGKNITKRSKIDFSFF